MLGHATVMLLLFFQFFDTVQSINKTTYSK